MKQHGSSVCMHTLDPSCRVPGAFSPCSTSLLLHPTDSSSLWHQPVLLYRCPQAAVTPTQEEHPRSQVSTRKHSLWTLPLEVPRHGRNRAYQVPLCLRAFSGPSKHPKHSKGRQNDWPIPYHTPCDISTTSQDPYSALQIQTHIPLHFNILAAKDMN